MRRIITIALTLLAGAGIVMAAPAPPAQAALSDCPVGWFCAWSGDNFTGGIFKYSFSGYGQSGVCNNLHLVAPNGDHDNWQSVYNRYGASTGPTVYYYADNGCNSSAGPLPHGVSNPHIGPFWYNQVSSFRVQ